MSAHAVSLDFKVLAFLILGYVYETVINKLSILGHTLSRMICNNHTNLDQSSLLEGFLIFYISFM